MDSPVRDTMLVKNASNPYSGVPLGTLYIEGKHSVPNGTQFAKGSIYQHYIPKGIFSTFSGFIENLPNSTSVGLKSK